ncbi:MAG: hypothetical protein PHW80_03935 [Smithellaceae bacterium]|nr:hypothetical protein [Smithellaceae bacterium]MDD3258323.1 hypothetical protein [Smithellaceae bacterium]MDD3848429.1 hypothetical protein [Smithellaceae bacterium]
MHTANGEHVTIIFYLKPRSAEKARLRHFFENALSAPDPQILAGRRFFSGAESTESDWFMNLRPEFDRKSIYPWGFPYPNIHILSRNI